MSLPVYTSDQMQQWDHYTIEHEPISSTDLMERAASLAAKSILGRNQFDRVAVFCGPGNNGGDGLVIARLLSEVGKEVKVFLLQFGSETKDFAHNFKRLPKQVVVTKLTEASHSFNTNCDLIVDCIFGSGLNRPLDGWIAQVIEQMNSQKAIKVAIDMPSGLFSSDNQSNTGLRSIFHADETLTFMAPKMPFFFASYAKFVGHFRILDIGLHPDFKAESGIHYLVSSDIQLHQPSTFDHKGSNGCLTYIGALENMSGAAILSTSAAMRSGVGYVYAVCDASAKTPLNVTTPEAIWMSPINFQLPTKTTAIAIGPGLGLSEQAVELLKIALKSTKPIILDADALNLISGNIDLKTAIPKNAILTPHLKELERLIGTYSSDEELLTAQQQFSISQGVYIIQKGPYSKLTAPDGKTIINSTGNPAMATAGMGDALTGIIGALLAKGYTTEQAATYGMYIHGFVGDQCAKNSGSIGVLATDIIHHLPHALSLFIRT